MDRELLAQLSKKAQKYVRLDGGYVYDAEGIFVYDNDLEMYQAKSVEELDQFLCEAYDDEYGRDFDAPEYFNSKDESVVTEDVSIPDPSIGAFATMFDYKVADGSTAETFLVCPQNQSSEKFSVSVYRGKITIHGKIQFELGREFEVAKNLHEAVNLAKGIEAILEKGTATESVQTEAKAFDEKDVLYKLDHFAGQITVPNEDIGKMRDLLTKKNVAYMIDDSKEGRSTFFLRYPDYRIESVEAKVTEDASAD